MRPARRAYELCTKPRWLARRVQTSTVRCIALEASPRVCTFSGTCEDMGTRHRESDAQFTRGSCHTPG